MERKYGWIKSKEDTRDHIVAFNSLQSNYPKTFDMRAKMPPIQDQGNLGSCTAHGIGALVQYKHRFNPSRLFIYYNERVLEDTVKCDCGATIRNGIKSISKIGVCEEKYWDYKIGKFAKKPPIEAYNNAQKNLIESYRRVNQTEDGLKYILSQGFPIVFGFIVKESFENIGKDGLYKPTRWEDTLGGHCVTIVGYNETHFICRNSYGEKWGAKGYFLMPFSEILNQNIASDFWII